MPKKSYLGHGQNARLRTIIKSELLTRVPTQLHLAPLLGMPQGNLSRFLDGKVGVGVPELWQPKTYLSVAALAGDNPTDGFLHPYKGRHAPGHSIEPNLLMHAVALREQRPDAPDYLAAAQTQARWIVEQLDWNDPRTTKGHRMSEHKTITGLVRLRFCVATTACDREQRHQQGGALEDRHDGLRGVS